MNFEAKIVNSKNFKTIVRGTEDLTNWHKSGTRNTDSLPKPHSSFELLNYCSCKRPKFRKVN